MKAFVIFASLAVVSVSAHAQSSVTLYGAVGGGVRWTSNTKGGSTTSFDGSSLAANIFGIQGTEDLGGGTHAVFDLETDFSTGNGSLQYNNIFFSRAAYVGVESRFGRVTFGRQLSSFDDMAVNLDPTYVNSDDFALSPIADLATEYFTGDTRFDNTVKYDAHTGGLHIGGSYSFGGVAGNTRAGSSYSAGASYQLGSLVGGLGYQRTYSTDASQAAQVYEAGASLQLGPTRFYMTYLGLMVGGSGSSPAQRRDSVPAVGVVYQITPTFQVTGAFYDDIANNLGNVQGANGHKATAYLIAEYFLSKRTELYAEVDRNSFSGAYKADPVNLVGLDRNPASNSMIGVSIGMLTQF
ncbi:porin [Paraburkholderia acidicola]|uniref:Porin n=1 Tax=Paraburkholderia acidicola TaxID=1912599 RepID=A0ABV1LF58_9BURK